MNLKFTSERLSLIYTSWSQCPSITAKVSDPILIRPTIRFEASPLPRKGCGEKKLFTFEQLRKQQLI